MSTDIDDPAVPPLERLEQAVTALGVLTMLHRRVMFPYLQVIVRHTGHELVFVSLAHENGPRYLWHGMRRSHPLDDPPGAAARIVERLHLQQPRATAEDR